MESQNLTAVDSVLASFKNAFRPIYSGVESFDLAYGSLATAGNAWLATAVHATARPTSPVSLPGSPLMPASGSCQITT